MTKPVVLQATKLFKRFGSETVLGPCDLAVQQDEVVVVVGASGAGKTTLLQTLAGLLPADDGEVYFDGSPLRSTSRRISVVFQDYGLFPWRTALRNVAFPLEVAKVPRAARRQGALAALEVVGLRESAHKYPHQLSGGMRQRTAIARAIVSSPSVLLLDEPMSALDMVTKRALQHQLAELVRERQLTTVIVTHDLTDAARMADRVVILAGRPSRIAAEYFIDRSMPESDIVRTLTDGLEAASANASDRVEALVSLNRGM